MFVYLAGMAPGDKKRERIWQKEHDRRLLTYAYEKGAWAIIDVYRSNLNMKDVENIKPAVRLFLDSGAFSARQQGIHIDLDKYIDFIKQNEPYLEVYANLDVIEDAAATLENQKKMEAAGLHPLPCFHVTEPFSYLDYYIENYDYIALGGVATVGAGAALFNWLDQCFSRICDEKGMPKVKVHGFAVTSMRAMQRYPWYSVDSTTWLLTSRMGAILVPHKLPGGNWDYMETLPGKATRKISVSTLSPSAKMPDQHFSTISKQWQAEVLQWLDEHGLQMGKSAYCKVDSGYKLKAGERYISTPTVNHVSDEFGVELEKVKAGDKRYIEIVEEPGVSNDYIARDRVNAMYFRELETHFPKWPWPWKRPALTGFGF